MKETKSKPFNISRHTVWEAYLRVKANRGSAGVDEQSIGDFEKDLKDNLYKIWNRMSSGTYFPPPVLRVEIDKDGGKKRKLGIPTVGDRIAQMVVKMTLEPEIEPYFHRDSYGYRPGKSAHGALEITRKRCWKHTWSIDMDIKGFFDNMDHEKVMLSVKRHTDSKWILLYVERWLKAPVQLPNGILERRDIGTPQGGVISPLLANLFLHYSFDEWMRINYPHSPFARYADDIIIHCNSKGQAEELLKCVSARMESCGLELHPEKTKIVYCMQGNIKEDHPVREFDFLGYTFRPRGAKTRKGTYFIGFLPAISDKAVKRLRKQIKDWKIHRLTHLTLQDLAKFVNPTVRGWIQYYGKFYSSELHRVLRILNSSIIRWARRKYKRFKRSLAKATEWIEEMTVKAKDLFAQWKAGYVNGWTIGAV
jgi:RNA-directed DNA polymerase